MVIGGKKVMMKNHHAVLVRLHAIAIKGYIAVVQV